MSPIILILFFFSTLIKCLLSFVFKELNGQQLNYRPDITLPKDRLLSESIESKDHAVGGCSQFSLLDKEMASLWNAVMFIASHFLSFVSSINMTSYK